MSRFVFFVGKGGVGKTTVSAAYALHRAGSRPKKPILLLSTDPAHSLADVLQQRLSDRPSRLKSRGQLWARQLDAQKELSRFLRAERQELLALLSKGSLFTAEEIEPFLDASLPGMAELAGLLAVHRLRESKFSEVVIDTAPIGHTLRLFHMPEHLVRFVRLLETATSRDEILAAQFGGHVSKEPALERWGEMLAQVKSAFAQEQAELVLVTTPEPFALSQSRRAEDSLKSGSWPRPFSRIVLNRAIRSRAKCALCQRRSQQTQVAYDWLRKKFPTAAILTGIDPGVPILGVKALASFGEHVFRGVRLPNSVLPAPDPSPAFKLVKAEWPQLRVPLTLSVGKGGVGKTTISVALAFRSRQQKSRIPVNICSVDPAPSLDDAFQTRVTDRLRPVLDDEGLRAAEMDAGAEFECWAGTLRDTISEALSFDQGGLHLDLQFERQFLLALLDVVPPGVDEIFATLRILELLRGEERVVIDMAPSGHALEVLRTPARLLSWTRLLLKTLAEHRTLPFARDAAVEVAKASQQARGLLSLLRDKKRTQVVVVTLPEPLPDYETQRLLRALHDLQVPVESVLINRVLLPDRERCSRCRRIREWQLAAIASLRRRLHGVDVCVVPEFAGEIAGAKALRKFTRELWRLV